MLTQFKDMCIYEAFLLSKIELERGVLPTILLNPRDYTYSWVNQNVPFGFLGYWVFKPIT